MKRFFFQNEEISFNDLPEELQIRLLLESFNYRWETQEEMTRFFSLQTLSSRFHKLFDSLLSGIEVIHPYIRNVKENLLPKITGPREIDFLLGIPDSCLSYIKQLHTLSIRGTDFSSFLLLRDLPLLRKLVTNSKIEDSGLIVLTNLTVLDLDSYSTISDVSIRELTNLTELKIRKRCFITLIKISFLSLEKLTKLRRLSLKDTLSDIKDLSLCYLPQLQRCSFSSQSCGRYYDFSHHISKFPNLEILSLKGSITMADESFHSLQKLKKLSLTRIHLKSTLFHTGLENLTRLRCRKVHMDWIGRDIFTLQNLTNLKRLSLKDCGGFYHQDLLPLTSLTSLNLHYDSYFKDDSITHLTNLTHINITRNGIISLEALYKLPKLETIKESKLRKYFICSDNNSKRKRCSFMK